MSFSFCLNKNEILLLAGFGLLFQGLDLDRRGKLIQDSQRLLCNVIEVLERNAAMGAAEFKKVVCAMISVERIPQGCRGLDDTAGRRKSEGSMGAPPKESAKSARKFQNTAPYSSTGNTMVVKQESGSRRRSTAPTLPTGQLSYSEGSISQTSVSSVVSDPLSQRHYFRRTTTSQSPRHKSCTKPPNLDYLSFNDPTPSSIDISPASSQQYDTPNLATQQVQPPLDSLFPSEDVLPSYNSPPPCADLGLSPDIWAIPSSVGGQPAASQGRVSFSDEDFTSCEELSGCDVGADFRGLAGVDGLVGLDGFDGDFGL